MRTRQQIGDHFLLLVTDPLHTRKRRAALLLMMMVLMLSLMATRNYVLVGVGILKNEQKKTKQDICENSKREPRVGGGGGDGSRATGWREKM